MDILGKKKVIIVALSVFLLAITAFVAFRLLSRPINEPTEPGMYFCAEKISREQAEEEGYWSMADPDEWVLKAIQNPGEYVMVDELRETFNGQVAEHNWIYNIRYGGRYYFISVFFIEPHRPYGDWSIQRIRETMQR